MSEIVSLDGITRSRAAILLCYPRYDEEEAVRRLEEMRVLGVESVELRGRHRVGELRVLGKGHVGVVVAARVKGEPCALKIRRIDADRASFDEEASRLALANSVSVGPMLLGYSSNFLLMELVEGAYLAEWVAALEPSDSPRLRVVLRRLLDDARRLDLVGLDHGELSMAYRHIIVSGDRPRIIDFESASMRRRVSNVTSVSQYLFFNRHMRKLIERIMAAPDADELVEKLRRYKKSPEDVEYRDLLRFMGIMDDS